MYLNQDLIVNNSMSVMRAIGRVFQHLVLSVMIMPIIGTAIYAITHKTVLALYDSKNKITVFLTRIIQHTNMNDSVEK